MMALSESPIPTDAQHYLVCGTENCERNCQFYCNDCHQPMCEQCRDKHQKNKKSKSHEVVPYKQRKRQLPVEKCQIHPTKEMVLLCEECQIPICYKCTATKEHRGHAFTDLEIDFDEKVSLCHEEIAKIRKYFEPASQDLKKEIACDVTEIKKIIDGIRTSMKAEAESLKKLVDTVTTENIKQVDKIEQSLLETLNGQTQKIDDYITYLNDLITTFYGYLSSSDIEQITLSLNSESFIIRPIPETSKPVPPVFTAGNFSKEDVTKLLGRITVQNTKPENRKIKPMETASTQLKPKPKQRKQDREKSDVKQTLSLSPSFTKVREYTVPGFDNVYHISLGKSGRLWVSDSRGNLVQTDLQGKQIQKIQTSAGYGYHTVTKDRDLIYTGKDNKVISRITPGNTITEFIKTGDWLLLSIHSSHINGDILVGMIKDREGKVTRYNKTGTEIQNKQRDNKGQKLYSLPHYITKNINGDVCVSDYTNAVVVVDKSGQHRFSYKGQGSRFDPYGICTDVLSHILVCGGINGDILVGMIKDREGKVTRYNKTGTEIQNIERDNKGQGLYRYPFYITENINGDICVSDYEKHAVVVVKKSGHHRFSYIGQGSKFNPFGMCTDVLGHILVCDTNSNTVHLLDQDGQFLSLLLTSQQGVKFPRSVCVDDENNLCVGQGNTNTVMVYKYLQ